jgi:hypothetical protein
MLRHTQIQGVQVRFVSAGLSYSTPEIIRHKDLADPVKVLESIDMSLDPEGKTL